MKNSLIASVLGICVSTVCAAAEVGEKAPGFTATDMMGEKVNLSDFENKVVVLEWINFGCPFVKKHYSSGNMQSLQEKYTGKDVVWLSVNSSAKGKQGYLESEDLVKKIEKEEGQATHVLVDTAGTVGKAYEAKVTPHMMIIAKDGTLAYSGAIDSNPSADPADIETADKLFADALDAVLAGEAVEDAKNKPYGCGVKY